ACTYNLTSNGSVDAFVAKLTQSGTSPFAGGPLANDKTDQLLDASPSDVMRYATIPTGAEFHVADSNLHGVRVADEFVNLSLRDEGEFAKSGEPVARGLTQALSVVAFELGHPDREEKLDGALLGESL